MSDMPHTQTRTRPENTTFFVVRQTFCLVTFGVHVSLLGNTHSLFFWVLSLCYIGLFPAFMRFTPILRDDAKRNLLLDTSLHGLFLGLWGFNPYLCVIYTAFINIINVISGGIWFGLKGFILLVITALLGGYSIGFYFREELPPITSFIASVGLLLFVAVLGHKIYQINTRLRQTRSRLEDQAEELTRLNHLATLINSNLNVDIVMDRVMSLIEEVYPFESMYILSFQNQNQQLAVTGIYGSSLTVEQNKQFRDLCFDIEKDTDSMFVHGLIRKKVIYLPTLSSDFVEQTAATRDRALFAIKPSHSIAYFPILVNDKVIGGACFVNYKAAFSLSGCDINKIQEYLVQVGTAVRNTMQFEELTKAKEIAIKAQSKAEASEEAKSRFLANMSHEIRTPLTAIMGYSEALQEENLLQNDEQINFVGHIVRSSQHLLTMINDILDISKIEAHKVEFEKCECNILEILLDIDSYMSIKAKEKNLALSINIEYPIPHIITSDPTRLKQILLNLCNNAIKFTEHGSISIEIKFEAEQTLSVSICDTGIGISAEAQKKVFNAFDQADTSTTRLFGGTGLGLCISKSLALLLGGDIEVHSQKDVGSTFIFTLPVTIPQGIPQPYIRSQKMYVERTELIKKSKISEGIPQLSGTALIAEDNPDNQDLISRLIRQTGMKIDVVENGKQAVESIKNKDYCLILLDMQMPIMGGREAAQIIKSSGSETPIIAFTANVMKHQIAEYKRLGFSGVLEKPIVKDKLFSILKTAVGQHSVQKRYHVLIVEDNEVNQIILSRYVNKTNENTTVLTAKNGQEAINYVKERNFDLILMDMEMPVLNGLDATIQIRNLGLNTPIYIVTGNTDKEYIQQCLAAGANGHLQKPLDKNKVIEAIENALR